ncbi:hypothetical protein H671_2g5704 [Cricetulus griseus]|nr:hypothetical protein H671_2g5704 [Cricetulus griseus]
MPLSTCTTHVRHICTGHSEATGGMRFVLYWNDSGSGKPFLLPLPMQRHPCCLWPPGISFQLHWLLFGARRLPVTGEQPGEPSLFWNCSCSVEFKLCVYSKTEERLVALSAVADDTGELEVHVATEFWKAVE